LLIGQPLPAPLVGEAAKPPRFALGSAANATLNNLFIGSAAAPLRSAVVAGFRCAPGAIAPVRKRNSARNWKYRR
jgi:hypothetical protein